MDLRKRLTHPKWMGKVVRASCMDSAVEAGMELPYYSRYLMRWDGELVFGRDGNPLASDIIAIEANDDMMIERIVINHTVDAAAIVDTFGDINAVRMKNVIKYEQMTLF